MAAKKSVPWIGYRRIKRKYEILLISRLRRPENALKFSVKMDSSLLRYSTLKKKVDFMKCPRFF